MADAQVGAITYQFKADIENLKAGMAQVRAQLQQMGQQAKQASAQISVGMQDATSSLREISSSLSGATLALRAFAVQTASGIVAGFSDGVRKAVNEVGALDEKAKRLTVTTQRLQEIQYSTRKLGGLSGDATSEGMTSLRDKANTEFRNGEGELTKLLEANNMKLVQRNGSLKTTEELLANAATLISRAGTEADKVDIANLFGLSKDWVATLEKGPEEFRKAQSEAKAAGAVIEPLSAEAKKFLAAWSSALDSWANSFRSAVVQATNMLAGLAGMANSVIARIAKANELAPGDGAGTAKRRAANQAFRDQSNEDRRALGIPELGAQTATQADIDSEAERHSGRRGKAPAGTFGPDNPTKVPGKESSGGGGGGGGSSSRDTIADYIEQLRKASDVAKAEFENWRLGNVERAKAVALAEAESRARKDGKTLSAEQKDDILGFAEATQRYKDGLEQLRQQQQLMRDQMRQFSQSLEQAFEGLILRGEKLRDVMRNLVQQIGSQALRSLFSQIVGGTGNSNTGLLGSLFGGGQPQVAPAGGGGSIISGIGNVLTSLFAGFRAEGGPVLGGRAYVVGERGPEMFFPSGGGTVIPNGGDAGGGAPQINQTFHLTGAITETDVMRMARGAAAQGVRAYDNSRMTGGDASMRRRMA